MGKQQIEKQIERLIKIQKRTRWKITSIYLKTKEIPDIAEIIKNGINLSCENWQAIKEQLVAQHIYPKQTGEKK